MQQMAQENPFGFRASVYKFAALGCSGGFFQQEFAMDSKTKMKDYVLLDGTKMIRTSAVTNFMFYNVRRGIASKKRKKNKNIATSAHFF